MRYISGWVESIVLRRKVGDFFHSEVGTSEKRMAWGHRAFKKTEGDSNEEIDRQSAEV